MPTSRHLKRVAALAFCASALIGATQIPSSSADLSGQIQSNKTAAQSLQSEIDAESAQIAQTQGGVAAAQARLQTVEANLDHSIAKLRTVQTEVIDTSRQLTSLEHRMALASTALASNLRAAYENGQPNLVDVVLSAHGFQSLLNQVNFMKRMGTQDAQILAFTKAARIRVMAEATRLGKLESADRDLTTQILAQRNDAETIKGALIEREISEENTRSGLHAHLASLNTQTAALQTKLNAIIAARAAAAAAAAQARETAEQQLNASVGVPVNTAGSIPAPPGAPPAVSQMIAAGNAIATLPYIWGGGHASFDAPGYDCSGSVSFVLQAAGLLSSPETSGEFESYGDPGPGQWVTIYANAGHVWMTIAGYRFDTVALAEGGTRWASGGGEYGGFVVRHPPGL